MRIDLADLDEPPGLVQPGERRVHSPSDPSKLGSPLGDRERADPPAEVQRPGLDARDDEVVLDEVLGTERVGVEGRGGAALVVEQDRQALGAGEVPGGAAPLSTASSRSSALR
ncbi:MAG: hypothetical protein M0035_08940 [Actinomycetota bacterium]|nr:hypothetical protein [Actinomycetota bacterium]